MALDNPIIMEFCRLCQCHIGKIPVNCNEELIQKINEVTKIEVKNELNLYLPMSVCVACFDKIMDIYSFIQSVQKVDKILRDSVKSKYFSHCEKISDCETSSNDNKLEEILKCTKYSTQFLDTNSLDSHVTTRLIKSEDFMCSVCHKTFESLSILNLHKKKHPELYCKICKQVFAIEIEHKNHKCNSIVMVNVKGDESGNINNFKRRSMRKAKPKFKLKPEGRVNFECSSCSKCFSKRSRLITHLKIHKNFICTQEGCSQELPTGYALKIHKLSHLGKRPFLCVTCGKGFMTKNSLNCHEKIHLEVKSYRCELCNIGFSVRSNLRAHEKTYHEGVRYYCSKCTKEFLTKCSLDRHEKTHIGVKEFQCAECSAAFYTKKELSKHQKYHKGLRLYKCEECFKTFFERHHLTIHLRSHNGERPYICKIPGCDKSYVDNTKLRRHHKAKHMNSG